MPENIIKIRELTERLSKIENDLAFFFDNIPVMFWVANKTGNLTKVNKEWTKYLGWSAEELTTNTWTSFVHHDDLKKTIEAADILNGSLLKGFINRFKTKDGDYKPMKWFASNWVEGSNYGVCLQENQ